MIDEFGAGDGEQPGGEVPVVTVPGEAFESGEEDLRGKVLGLFHTGGAAEQVTVDRLHVAVVQRAEGLRVSPRGGNLVFFRGHPFGMDVIV